MPDRDRSLVHRFAPSVLAAALLLLAPAHASAVNYCVNDQTCATNGGTVQPTIEAAAIAANASAGSDRIFVGASATPYQLSSTVTFDASNRIFLFGAGRGTTTIVAPAGMRAFDLQYSTSRLSRATIIGTNASGTIVNLSDGTTADNNLDDVEVENLGIGGTASAVAVLGTAKINNSALKAHLSLSGSGSAVTTSGTTTGVSIVDSTLRGRYGVDFRSTGTLTMIRDTVHFSDKGVRANAADAAQTVRIGSTLLEGDTGLLSASARAVDLTASAPGATTSIAAELRNLTIVHPNGTPTGNAIFATSQLGGVGKTASITLNVDDTISAGPWSSAVAIGGTPDANNTVNGTITNFDGYPTALGMLGTFTTVNAMSVDPRFTSPLTGNYRLRYGSPLIDAGALSGTLPSWLGNGDLDMRSRPTLSSAPVGTGTSVNDFGAYEYHAMSPQVAISPEAVVAQPGQVLTFSASASDDNVGEAAQTTFTWGLPGGASASGATVTFAAPTTPGTYAVTVTGSDPVAGFASAQSATVVVPTPADAPDAAAPTLADVVPPKVRLAPVATTLAKLLKRTAVSVKLAPDESVGGTLVLSATVTTPPKRGHKATSKVVTLGTAAVPQKPGARTVKVVPTAAGLRKLASLRATRGARTTFQVTAAVADPAGNRTSAIAKVVVR